MLYSESKERENRFKLALKISLPFLFILAFIFVYIYDSYEENFDIVILFTILIPIYIYYIFYLIYRGFHLTLIDNTTNAFNRKEILREILKSKENSIISLVKLENISDINERYGVDNADEILKKFIKKLDNFFLHNGFKDVKIGRYSGGNFLFILDSKNKNNLAHLLRIFSNDLKNNGIDEIEIKIGFSLIERVYDKSVKNIVKKLFDLIENKSEENLLNFKPNEFEKIILDAIENERFLFKFQQSKSLKNSSEIVEVLTKIYSKNGESFSKSQIQRVINHIKKETLFDKKVMKALANELRGIDLKDRLISIELSAVSLRNAKFKDFLEELFLETKLNPNSFVLEFSEKHSYEDMKRFKNILEQYKQMGFKIALRNFGGNNSSLEYIKHLPIDIVKLDIEFTKNLEDRRYREILKSYVLMLKSLDVKIMIKFVDKIEIKKRLEEFEFDYVQGFLISKPKDLKEML